MSNGKIIPTAFLIAALIFGCRNNSQNPVSAASDAALSAQEISVSEKAVWQVHDTSPDGKKLEDLGFVNVLDVDSTLIIKLVYATVDNFMGEVLYENLREAYLLPDAASMLAEAHLNLKKENPDYRLIVYDAARPMSVQRKMRETAVRQGKQYYVANPANGGGLHNYGAAVDVSIVDDKGNLLPMGTDYDHLGFEANTDTEQELVKDGHITEIELRNRLLLRRVMRTAGFRTISSEWWHFNFCSREEAMRKYELIDF